MSTRHSSARMTKRTLLSVSVLILIALYTASAEAAFTFTGVAAGDATSSQITLWTRAVDDAAPAPATVLMELATDPDFSHIVASSTAVTSALTDYTIKFAGTGLQPSKVYY